MKNTFYLLILVLAAFGLFLAVPRTKTSTQTGGEKMIDSASTNNDQKTTDGSDFSTASKAVIKTDKGDIEVELYPNDAPQTVQNFITLAKRGYYNNLTFHRVEPGFVIQGGDPNGNGIGGTSIYGAKFNDELNPDTASYKAGYKEGVLAMANSGPNTNGSQFFIMLADNDTLPKSYSIFGKVTSGMDVVKKVSIGTVIKTITPQ